MCFILYFFKWKIYEKKKEEKKKVKERLIKTVIYCDEGKKVGKKTRRVKIGSPKGGGKKKRKRKREWAQ